MTKAEIAALTVLISLGAVVVAIVLRMFDGT